MDEGWDKFERFGMHGQNKVFVKYLLSRISGYVDTLAGQSSDFGTYFHKGAGKPFEIEHIWSQHFAEHQEEEGRWPKTTSPPQEIEYHAHWDKISCLCHQFGYY